MLIVHGQAVKDLDRAELVERPVEHFSLVHLACADEQSNVVPGKCLELIGKGAQAIRYVLGGSSPFIAQEIAILEPNDLGVAKEGQGLEGFTKLLQGLERLAAVRGGSINNLVVRSAELPRP